MFRVKRKKKGIFHILTNGITLTLQCMYLIGNKPVRNIEHLLVVLLEINS